MGFYFELKKTFPTLKVEYTEGTTPTVFWLLYAIAGFALACMAGAATQVLGDLYRAGSSWDRAIIYSLIFVAIGYLFIGLRLALVRKFVALKAYDLVIGYRVGAQVIWKRAYPREDIEEVVLINQKPSTNVAPSLHDEKSYYVQGHWRICVKLKSGTSITIDRHNDRDALLPLYEEFSSAPNCEDPC